MQKSYIRLSASFEMNKSTYGSVIYELYIILKYVK